MLPLISSSLGWLADTAHAKAQHALIAVLKAGPIPQHVAFILDGNRRYARSKHKQIKQGHTDGFYTLRKVRALDAHAGHLPDSGQCSHCAVQMLEICIHLNVRCVSAYAFSIENFKRSPEEVEALMDLAEEKLLELCQEGYVLFFLSRDISLSCTQ